MILLKEKIYAALKKEDKEKFDKDVKDIVNRQKRKQEGLKKCIKNIMISMKRQNQY